MTKLLHVTDLHANRRWFDWTLDHAGDFDLIAFTGDFVDAYVRWSPETGQVGSLSPNQKYDPENVDETTPA